MVNVIYANIDRINRLTTTVDVAVVDSIDHTTEKTVLLESNHSNIQDFSNHTVYVPASALQHVKGEKVKVYHELAQYPFFQQARSMIHRNDSPKGVFRLRRVLAEEKNDFVIASDLYVLSSLFGEAEIIDVKHSRGGLDPQHVIVTVKYGDGVMAHVDYTFTSKEIIELEWSGINQIIEFKSDEMNPMDPGHLTTLPLQYNVDSILETAVELDVVAPELAKYQEAIGGVEA
ncbi:hypothetical protein [Ornithinibacillus scapharcae]|uniref:hypothetical protein n=1 Tax=Ornithinibacillus scapharcae TaxID=1147159 RepID=UPI000225BB5D|nr:hypothetical protein [Ornithinibacillus scapharcae]